MEATSQFFLNTYRIKPSVKKNIPLFPLCLSTFKCLSSEAHPGSALLSTSTQKKVSNFFAKQFLCKFCLFQGQSWKNWLILSILKKITLQSWKNHDFKEKMKNIKFFQLWLLPLILVETGLRAPKNNVFVNFSNSDSLFPTLLRLPCFVHSNALYF